MHTWIFKKTWKIFFSLFKLRRLRKIICRKNGEKKLYFYFLWWPSKHREADQPIYSLYVSSIVEKFIMIELQYISAQNWRLKPWIYGALTSLALCLLWSRLCLSIDFEGLKFLVRICTDLGLKDVQDYAQKLKKAEKARELKQQVKLTNNHSKQ